MTDEDLIGAATALAGAFAIGTSCFAGGVAAALVTRGGNLYTGICIDTLSSLGFCAEHAAVAEMLKQRETDIDRIVAVTAEGIIPPCGRCRELLWQVSPNASVIVGRDERISVRDLLPMR